MEWAEIILIRTTKSLNGNKPINKENLNIRQEEQIIFCHAGKSGIVSKLLWWRSVTNRPKHHKLIQSFPVPFYMKMLWSWFFPNNLHNAKQKTNKVLDVLLPNGWYNLLRTLLRHHKKKGIKLFAANFHSKKTRGYFSSEN